MTFLRRHGFMVAALAIAALLVYWHYKCPTCRNRAANLAGGGLRVLSGGQAVGEGNQYIWRGSSGAGSGGGGG